ncbi:hypothetical protein BDK51DRAFT_37744, partial [Blyttiomyces helicus]
AAAVPISLEASLPGKGPKTAPGSGYTRYKIQVRAEGLGSSYMSKAVEVVAFVPYLSFNTDTLPRIIGHQYPFRQRSAPTDPLSYDVKVFRQTVIAGELLSFGFCAGGGGLGRADVKEVRVRLTENRALLQQQKVTKGDKMLGALMRGVEPGMKGITPDWAEVVVVEWKREQREPGRFKKPHKVNSGRRRTQGSREKFSYMFVAAGFAGRRVGRRRELLTPVKTDMNFFIQTRLMKSSLNSQTNHHQPTQLPAVPAPNPAPGRSSSSLRNRKSWTVAISLEVNT